MRVTEIPEGYIPSGRTEDEIRANLGGIPRMTLNSPHFSPEVKKELRAAWWEEILLNIKDNDEEAAYREEEWRNRERQ